MTKKILFVIDKVELKYFEFNNLVTNFWLIKEFLEKNIEVFITTIQNLELRNNKAYTYCNKTYQANNNIYYHKEHCHLEINSFDLVLFRPDPPVNIDYINATYIFDFVNTKVINTPSAIRNFNEKLHSLYFKEYMTDTIVTSSQTSIEEFLNTHKQIVLKPLNNCFGNGVMYLYQGDPNTRTIINTLTNNQNTIVMAQKFLPEIKNGDTRVLTLGDKILPYCIKKLPGENDFKFNTHNDDFLIKTTMSKQELEYFTPIAKRLNELGIVMAGLDVIGNQIIEINVTSPCYFIKEINKIYNINLEKIISEHILTYTLLSV